MRQIVALLFVLAACSPEPREEAGPSENAFETSGVGAATNVKADTADPGRRNRAHMRLLALSDAERNRMMLRFMEASGERCGRVTRTFYQGSTPEGEAMWNVACSISGDWSIKVDPNASGSTTILECNVLAAFGTRCWERFES